MTQIPKRIARVTAVASIAARYIATRATLPARYQRSALDRLLAELDVVERSRSLDDVELGIRIGEAIARRAVAGPQTCLFRALGRFALLRASGHEAQFVLGVSPHSDEPGHAWIEIGGASFLERSVPPMVEALRYPPTRSAGEVDRERA